MKSFNWTCPYCRRDQAVTELQFSLQDHYIHNPQSVHGPVCLVVQTIRCANEQCRELTLSCSLNKARLDGAGKYQAPLDTIHSWRLLPESAAKPQPDYIPRHIVEDYAEACRIRDLSPKASATLSRRCLQSMIRDFCAIKGASLHKEIVALRRRAQRGEAIQHVHQETIDALDHVRKIGNIGAHMDQDANLMVNVDPLEAQKLIELIELLFDEWYVRRDTRNRKLKALKDIADKKTLEKRTNGTNGCQRKLD